MAVSRETLYEEVWADPMIKVASRYEVSGSFLARVCERLNVPRPPRGYWAQLAVGKACARPPLPPAQPGDELEWSRDGSLPRAVPRPPPQPPPPPATSGVQPQVPKRSRASHHALVVAAQEHFQHLRESRSRYLKPLKQLVADVFVSKDTLERALQMANNLYLALEDHGYRVVIAAHSEHLRRADFEHRAGQSGPNYDYSDRWGPGRPTVTYVGTVAIGLTIYEVAEEIEFRYVDGEYVRLDSLPRHERARPQSWNSWTRKEHVPNGRLALRAYSPYSNTQWDIEWKESRVGELRNKLDEVIRELELGAPVIATLVEKRDREAEEWRKKWEAEERERQLRLQEERRRQAHKDSREQLLSMVDAWALACQIDAFFERASKEAAASGAEDAAVLLERLKRARELFGGTDALPRFRAWLGPEERLGRDG